MSILLTSFRATVYWKSQEFLNNHIQASGISKFMHINMFFTINKMGTEKFFEKSQNCFCSVLAGRKNTTVVRSDQNVPLSKLREFWKFLSFFKTFH